MKEYFQEQQSLLALQNFSYVMALELFEEDMVKWELNAARLKDAFSVGEQQCYNYLIENKQADSKEIAETLSIIVILNSPSYLVTILS